MDFDEARNVFAKKYADCSPSPKIDWKNYENFGILGSGSYGRVFLVRDKRTEQFVACKKIMKARVCRANQVNQIIQEKKLQKAVAHPFIINLLFTTKDNEALYFFMPLMIGGNVLRLLRRYYKLTEPCSRFISAQVVLGLEYLHAMNIVYRDIKPENILIDEIGYIKLADLGSAKVANERTVTFCGTPEFIAPEMLSGKGYGTSVDWWSFGIFLFELNEGHTPFYSDRMDRIELYRKIANAHFYIPNTFSLDLQDFIQKLLQVDVSKRLGCTSNRSCSDEIKQHKWYKDIDWTQIYERKFISPIKSSKEQSELLKKYSAQSEQIYSKLKICLFEANFDQF